MNYELASKNPGKLPVVDAVRLLLTEHVAPRIYAAALAQQLEAGNGENLTTKQDSLFVNITGDDGKPAGRVMISWSGNYWEPKTAEQREKGKRTSALEDDSIPLVPNEIKALDAAITTFQAEGDVANTVKLMTIKEFASQNKGRVSREQYRIVSALK